MPERSLPVIDVSSLTRGDSPQDVAAQIREACTTSGFFYVVGHGIPASLLSRLDELSREFFALPLEEKMRIRMALGGRAWRGFFPVGDELTKGEPDQKEGLYFGTELSPSDERVRAGTALHGPNLFPEIEGFRETLLDYLAALTDLGQTLLRGVALSLDLDADFFAARYTSDPLILFRIFNYPALERQKTEALPWSVGEHTDYGLLTILHQDGAGGLEVKHDGKWKPAPPVEGAFVCNIGDMLDRMTRGHYRSTPHRVRNLSERDRLSFAFFFDPNWDAQIEGIPGIELERDDRAERWDGASVHEFEGTYGDYVLQKVSKVFPYLADETEASD